MGNLYYATEIAYRFFKQSAKSNKQVDLMEETRKSANEVVYVELSAEDIVKCQETIKTTSQLDKWLRRKNLPPDGYTSPYDGSHNAELVQNMLKEIQKVVAVKRTYAALQSKEDGLTVLEEARKCFFQVETREEQEERYKNLGIPSYIQGSINYTDEVLQMVLGKKKEPTNYIAAAKLLCGIWAEIVSQNDTAFSNQYGYTSRTYKKDALGKNVDTGIKIHWWTVPKGRNAAFAKIDEKMDYIKRSCYYYLRKWADGDDEMGTKAPTYWQNTITRREAERIGPIWKSYQSIFNGLFQLMCHEFFKYPSKEERRKRAEELVKEFGTDSFDEAIREYVQYALDDYLNLKLEDIEYQIDTRSKKKVLLTENIVTVMYAYLAEELQHGLKYKKCALCDRYFLVGNKTNKKYCEIHAGPNAEYYRRQLCATNTKKSEKA